MFEVIKSLTPKQRIWAFIIAVIFSSITAIGTSYFKTDDCLSISTQYDSMMVTYANQLKLNNQIMDDSNKKTKDILEIKRLLDSMLSLKPQTLVERTLVRRPQTNEIQRDDSRDSIRVLRSVREPEPVVQIKRTVVPVNQKPILKKMTSILEKYDASSKH
jgi:hypothetical protein